MAEEIENLLIRAQAAETKRDAMRPLMQEVYRYTMPERDAWNSYGLGEDRNALVYDDVGMTSVSRFANRLQSSIFPAKQRWSALQLPEEARGSGDMAQELAKNLDDATRIMFRNVHASNFDAEINPVCHDIAAGVGCMLVENGRYLERRSTAPIIRCQAVAPAHLAFDEGPYGTVEGVFFTQCLVGRLLKRHYKDAKVPQELADGIRDKPEAELTFLQATTYDAPSGKWLFQLIHRDSKALLLTRKYRTNPWIIVRWTRIPGQSYARGPALQSLPTIRVVNKLQELMLISGSFNADPNYTVMDDGVINADTVSVIPGQFIPVRSNGGTFGPSIKLLERPTNMQFNQDMLDRRHTSIRQTLFDSPLPPEVQVGLTATEILERMRLFQQDTGSFGRLHQDAVVPFTLRFVDILEEAGQFDPKRFPGLFEALRQNLLQVGVTSPMARAQDQADVQAVMSMISGAVSLGEFGARMLAAAVNPDKAGRFIAMRTGVPADMIPSEQEIAAAAKAAAEQQRNQQMLSSPVVGQAVGAIGGAIANQAAGGQPQEAAQ